MPFRGFQIELKVSETYNFLGTILPPLLTGSFLLFLYCFQNVWKIPLSFSIKKEVLKDFLISKFVIDMTN